MSELPKKTDDLLLQRPPLPRSEKEVDLTHLKYARQVFSRDAKEFGDATDARYEEWVVISNTSMALVEEAERLSRILKNGSSEIPKVPVRILSKSDTKRLGHKERVYFCEGKKVFAMSLYFEEFESGVKGILRTLPDEKNMPDMAQLKHIRRGLIKQRDKIDRKLARLEKEKEDKRSKAKKRELRRRYVVVSRQLGWLEESNVSAYNAYLRDYRVYCNNLLKNKDWLSSPSSSISLYDMPIEDLKEDIVSQVVARWKDLDEFGRKDLEKDIDMAVLVSESKIGMILPQVNISDNGKMFGEIKTRIMKR